MNALVFGNLLSLINPLLHLVLIVNAFVASSMSAYVKLNGPVIVGLVILYVQLKLSRFVLGHVVRTWPMTGPLLIRPVSANNCNIMNSGGKLDNPWIGMPSGHVMSTAFILTLYGLMIPRLKNSTYYWLFVVALVMLVSTGRVLKECHTVNQCIVGCICGILLAVIVSRNIRM